MARLTSASATSTVAESSLGMPPSTSGVEDEMVAVLVMPSPLATAVTSTLM